MIVDIYGSVVMQHSTSFGNIGDAFAETSRVKIWAETVGNKGILSMLNTDQFRTPKGYLRHINAPFKGDIDSNGEVVKESWREDDTSGDQYSPGYEGFTLDSYRKEMRNRVVKNFLRYGNNNLIQPGFAAQMLEWNWAKTRAMEAQANMFKFKWRWSDEFNRFEPMENSAADYMNWFTLAKGQPDWLIHMVPKDVIKQKIEVYYGGPEKESANWVIQLAHSHVDVVWGSR